MLNTKQTNTLYEKKRRTFPLGISFRRKFARRFLFEHTPLRQPSGRALRTSDGFRDASRDASRDDCSERVVRFKRCLRAHCRTQMALKDFLTGKYGEQPWPSAVRRSDTGWKTPKESILTRYVDSIMRSREKANRRKRTREVRYRVEKKKVQ